MDKDILNDKSIITIWDRCKNCDVVFELPHSCAEVSQKFTDVYIRKRDGLETLPTTGYSSLLPYQTPQVKEYLKKIFFGVPPSVIIDCTCHIGGDTLHFAETFPESRIIAIDVDICALKCLKGNMEKCNVPKDRITLIQTDCVKWIQTVKYPADLYYFDPPWGGPSYTDQLDIELVLGDTTIEKIINFILEAKLTNKILLKAPKNFAVDLFQTRVKGKITINPVTKPKKNNEVAYLLILIEP